MIRKFKQVFKLIVYTLIVNILLFVFLEGICSLALSIRAAMSRTDFAYKDESYFARYDELLGWTNIPNFEQKDLFAPGVYFKTNSQSFRNDKDFSINIPKGKIRIICCGDSYTLGFDVNNDQTWCQQLASIDKRLETINMGQAGYGVDQAYLWYMRDGRKFEHNVHIFAFIIDDFDRMKHDLRGVYGKPTLKVVNGKLVVNNVPVPKRGIFFRKLIYNAFFDTIRLRQFLDLAIEKLRLSPQKTLLTDDEVKKVALKIFDDLERVNKAKNSTLVLVNLPVCYSDPNVEPWRKWLKVETKKRGIVYIDLYEDYLQLPYAEVEPLFIPEDGHYSVRGNRFIAQILYKKLFSSGGLLHKLYLDKM